MPGLITVIDSTACLVFTTCPDHAAADELAAALIERRLAACVSVGGPVTSRYRWKDRVETDDEVPVTIKTRTDYLERLEKAFAELHPYEVPEMLAVPVVWGHGPYLDWITENLYES